MNWWRNHADKARAAKAAQKAAKAARTQINVHTHVYRVIHREFSHPEDGHDVYTLTLECRCGNAYTMLEVK